MKNIHIKNLYQEVPADIRLEVYYDALNHFSTSYEHRRIQNAPGLCLALPVLLWGLDSSFSLGPADNQWGWEETTIAFPELTRGVINTIVRFAPNYQDHLRVEYLKQWIKDLEQTL